MQFRRTSQLIVSVSVACDMRASAAATGIWRGMDAACAPYSDKDNRPAMATVGSSFNGGISVRSRAALPGNRGAKRRVQRGVVSVSVLFLKSSLELS